MEDKKILLSHGSGGMMMHSLIKDIFLRHFKGNELAKMGDSAILAGICGQFSLSFTTDSYTVNPLFFPGGDIGKLSVCGTVNDISVSGARPLFISCAVIAEEGFDKDMLEKIVVSMSKTARLAGIEIVTGDFKVVEKGKMDGLFINTSAIGISPVGRVMDRAGIRPGDRIIINGFTGDHELSVLLARNEFKFSAGIKSDCAPLNELVKEIMDSGLPVRFMRDPTRGGVATTLNEISDGSPFGIRIREADVPVREETRAVCELLGFDPLYLANEGKVIVICPGESSERLLCLMRKHKYGKDSALIGEVVESPRGRVILDTAGGSRILDMLSGSQLPRIC
jgi:hydrogenase expression/formation protein HypE